MALHYKNNTEEYEDHVLEELRLADEDNDYDNDVWNVRMYSRMGNNWWVMIFKIWFKTRVLNLLIIVKL